MELEIMLDDGAKMPTKAHKTDAGYDLYSRCYMTVPYLGSAVFDTGVHINIPEGYCGLLVSKSGLNANHGITSTGLIDSGYTGSILVRLDNHGQRDYMVAAGDKISQLVILPCFDPDIVQVDGFAETDRGTAGFGSSGR